MSPFIVLLVLVSAALHPLWNLLVKQGDNPFRTYLYLTATMSLIGLTHGLIIGADIFAVRDVWPLILLSFCGQIIYGLGLTATLKRGDLSAYYPIIRASPVVIVIASMVFLGQTYSLATLGGILMAVAGGFILLYRRGTHFLSQPLVLGLALTAMTGTGIYSLADTRIMQVVAPPVQLFWVEGLLSPIYLIIFLAIRRRSGEAPAQPIAAVSAVRRPPWRRILQIILPGVISYSSYYLILLAYQYGGEVAAVTSVRQASIPVSVLLGGLYLREGAIARRLIASLILALGIIIVAAAG